MSRFSTKECQRLAEGLPPWESMSFACGGWLQFYMFGVAKALQYKGLDKGVIYCGCSAGALTSAGLVLEGDFDDAIRYCKEEGIPKAYSGISGLFKLDQYVLKCLDLHLLSKFREIPPNILQIAVTKLWFFTPEKVTKFDTKQHLIDNLLASSAAFPFASLVKINGSWYIDGGLSDFQPIVDEDTITVSPFYFSDCDIKPSRYVPIWWCVFPPPSNDTIDWLYNLGYHDCISYIQSRGIPTTPKRDTTFSPILSAKNSHEFDEPRRIRYPIISTHHTVYVCMHVTLLNFISSIHRFLGYDLKNMTSQYVAFVMDFLLLILFLALLKPLAMLLIYVELILTMLYLALRIGLLQMRTMLVNKAPNTDTKTLQRCCVAFMDCIACFMSLSLFLRWFSGGLSSAQLRKHDRLAKSSILYRIFRHII